MCQYKQYIYTYLLKCDLDEKMKGGMRSPIYIQILFTNDQFINTKSINHTLSIGLESLTSKDTKE